MTNKVNGKQYVGITNNYPKRMREHRNSKTNLPISRAIRKYGWENFSSVILTETEDREDEIIYIQHYRPVYNLTEGGDGTVGFSPSTKSRAKMRKAKVGKPLSESHKQNISKSQIGRVQTKHTKELIGAAMVGNKNWLGKHHKESTKDILSRVRSKEYRVLDPNGKIIEVTNMKNFCEENMLEPAAMSRVTRGKQYSHKGWKAYL